MRLLFKQVDDWKVERTRMTNRANGLLTGFGFTVFRLVPINSVTGFQIIQAILDNRSPQEIAVLHRNKAKRAEIEKCAAVELPDYLKAYLKDVLNDLRLLNQRIQAGEISLLSKISTNQLDDQIGRMCTVPGVTQLLALRIIAEMGVNYHQRYYSAEAFAKAIGVVPANEVSGGKLLKRRASHGNQRLKMHLLFSTKAYVIHGRGPLREWFDRYRARSNYMKAISALARRIAEALWWVLVRDEPYRYWTGEPAPEGSETIRVGDLLVSTRTGEILQSEDPSITTSE